MLWYLYLLVCVFGVIPIIMSVEYLTVVFIYISLTTSDVEHVLIGHLFIFGEMSFLCPFLLGYFSSQLGRFRHSGC